MTTTKQTDQERSWRELYEALEAVAAALDDASSVVDASDDEEYAYQAELELARRVLAKYRETSAAGEREAQS